MIGPQGLLRHSSISSHGGNAAEPELNGAKCQPLSYLAYIAANCHTVLAQLAEVDPKRIGIMGHSYGSKWTMLASCLYDKFACAVWSDGGWMAGRGKAQNIDAPISVYEVHVGSWKRAPGGRMLSYEELAKELVGYVAKMGFTHIELMLVSECPFDG